MFSRWECKTYVSNNQRLQNPKLFLFYNRRVGENPRNIHEVASPEIEEPVDFDYVDQICVVWPVAEWSVGGLLIMLLTMNRYLTLSIGAIKVLLHIPAMPPAMKLFKILYFFLGYYCLSLTATIIFTLNVVIKLPDFQFILNYYLFLALFINLVNKYISFLLYFLLYFIYDLLIFAILPIFTILLQFI